MPWDSMPFDNYVIAIEGKAFNFLIKQENLKAVLYSVLMKGQIFARMSPDDKARLVTELQKFCRAEVGMCGDGANDCAALKAADSGVSLSNSEASIAAPFNS